MELHEGNRNYGENVMIWDHIFRSFFNEDRRPPENIGIPQYMPPGFLHQLVWPFVRIYRRQLKTVYPPGYVSPYNTENTFKKSA